MSHQHVLILDYSIDKIEAAAIGRWLPEDARVTTLFIDTESSFPDDLITRDYTHVIHSGSSLSINKPAPFTAKAVRYIRDARDAGVAQFGICYGHQLVCLALVGQNAVQASPNGMEAGWGAVTFTDQGMERLGVRQREVVWQSHFDEVIELPDGSILLATNDHTLVQAFINLDLKILGTQFHPEFDKESGDKLYLEERELLETHGYDVDAIITKGPTLDTGKMFFGYFLR